MSPSTRLETISVSPPFTLTAWHGERLIGAVTCERDARVKVSHVGKIVGMMPDPKHPTNNGLQCIKGLASAEAIYVDRLTKPLIRRDMTDQLTGHESATKGRFSDDVFREATWEEKSMTSGASEPRAFRSGSSWNSMPWMVSLLHRCR